MSFYNNDSAISLKKPTLALSGIRAYVFQVLLLTAAVILPVIAHLSGVSVRYVLPMHWPVILAGLVYGWRAGLLTGLLAPMVNYLFSGFPLPHIIPSMTVELVTYGMTAGFLREVLRFNPFISVAIALVFGRIVFAASVVFGNVVPTDLLVYFQAALVPGIIAAVLQIALLPFIAKWWIKQEQHPKKEQV